MNEITIHGNLTANPVVHHNPNTDRSVTTFDVAVNSRYFDRGSSQWRDRPAVYHKVACFGELGSNTAQTLRKGMTVTVTGSFADDSYTPQGSDRPLRRLRLEAADVAVSLRWAVAAVARQTSGTEQVRAQAAQQSATVAADRPESVDEPAAAATPVEEGEDASAEPAASGVRSSGRRGARRPESAAA